MKAEQRGRGVGTDKVLWMVNHYAVPPTFPGGTRHFWLAKRLQEFGWDTRIVCSASASSEPVTGRAPRVIGVDGVEMTCLAGSGGAGHGVARLRSWVEFGLHAMDPKSTGHLPRPDAVMGSTVHPIAALAGLGLARRHRVPFVYEIRDTWPETPIRLGHLKRGSARARVLIGLEKLLLRSADLIVSPLSGLSEYLATHLGPDRSEFVWISNGVDTDSYGETGVPAHPGPGLRIQYFGALGLPNNLRETIRSVWVARTELGVDVRLRMVGKGLMRDELQDYVAELGAEDYIEFFPPVPSSEVKHAMQWGNALVWYCSSENGREDFGVSPNKLFDYLASGQWLLIAAEVPNSPAEGAPGVTCTRPTEMDLARGIAEASRISPTQRATGARGNLALARKKYDFRALAKRLGGALDDLVSGRPR